MLTSFAAASLLRRSICSRKADRRAERIASNSDSCAVKALAQSSRMRSSSRRRGCMQQGGPECSQSLNLAYSRMVVRYHTHCIFAPKKRRSGHTLKLLSPLGNFFLLGSPQQISSPVISTCKSGCCKDGFSGTGSNCGSPLAFSILMSKLEERDWRKLCELVTKETDPLKLDELLEQLTEALDARVKQLDIHSYSSTPNRDRRCRLKPI
jgi:hypothetical protein